MKALIARQRAYHAHKAATPASSSDFNAIARDFRGQWVPTCRYYLAAEDSGESSSGSAITESAKPTLLIHRSEVDGLWSATFADGPRGLTWLGYDLPSADDACVAARERWPAIDRVRIIDDVLLTRAAPPARRGGT